MKLIISNSYVQSFIMDQRICLKSLGDKQCAKLLLRLNQLQFSKDFDSLRTMPGHFHPLKANRAGEWSCHLIGPLRLVFRACPSRENCVEILEIINYHGK
jgi:proteic killer suppression protein